LRIAHPFILIYALNSAQKRLSFESVLNFCHVVRNWHSRAQKLCPAKSGVLKLSDLYAELFLCQLQTIWFGTAKAQHMN